MRGSVWADSRPVRVSGGGGAVERAGSVRRRSTRAHSAGARLDLTVEIGWQRDGGIVRAARQTTQRFVLQIGPPQVLDTLPPTSTSACGVTSCVSKPHSTPIGLRVPFGYHGLGGAMRRGSGLSTGTAAAGGGSAGGAGGRGRRTAVTGVNGAGTSATPAAAAAAIGISQSRAVRRPRSSSRACWRTGTISGSRFAPPRAAAAASAAFGSGRGAASALWTPPERLAPMSNRGPDAELWLVHTPTSGTEETQPLAVHFGRDREAAAFPASTVSTSNGPATG